jgi:hypothetical protein
MRPDEGKTMSRHWFAALAPFLLVMILLLIGCDRPKAADSPPPALEPAPAAAAAAVSTVPAGWKTFSDPVTGIAFDYGPDRHTGDCPEIGEGVVCVALFAAAETEALIQFQPVDGALGVVAREQAGFEKNDKGVLMTTYGRFEPVPVEPFVARGGSGLKAIVTCGVEDEETGFHAAGGECLWAVVGHGAHAVVATTLGRIGTDEETMKSLASLRFVPKTGQERPTVRPG